MDKRRVLVCVAMSVMLALILAICCDAALFGLWRSKSRAPVVVRHSLVVFPFDMDSELAASVPEDFGMNVAEYLRMMLVPSKGYAALLYEERLTPIRRAKDDNVLKDQEIKAPFFTDKAKMTKLADILETDYYLIGSVESYAYDRDKKTVELTLKADLMQVMADKANDKMVQEFVVGGSAEAGNQAIEEDELLSIAAGRAVEALRDKIFSTSPADAKPVVVPKAQPKAAEPKPAEPKPGK